MPTTRRLVLPRPHAAQQQILDEARRFNVLCCGRRFGKSVLGINLLVPPALDGYPVAYFSPSYKMLTESWREVRWLLQPATARVSEQEHRIDLLTGGVVEMWSADNPDAARGRKYARAVIDEAARIKRLLDFWQAAVRPTLTDYAGDAWFESTPKGYDDFADLFARGQSDDWPEWMSWQLPTLANPYIMPSEVEAARQELPGLVYAQEYEALFVSPGGSVFERDWWENRNRYQPAALRPVAARWLSWDTAMVANEDAAYTACVVVEIGHDRKLSVREVYRERLTFPQLTRAIEAQAERWNRDGKLRQVVIEDQSSGTSAIQTLRASAAPWLRGKITGWKPRGSKEERATRAAVWCRNGMVLLPEPGADVPWLLDFESELLRFPQSAFRDQVDAFSQAVIYLENWIKAGYTPDSVADAAD